MSWPGRVLWMLVWLMGTLPALGQNYPKAAGPSPERTYQDFWAQYSRAADIRSMQQVHDRFCTQAEAAKFRAKMNAMSASERGAWEKIIPGLIKYYPPTVEVAQKSIQGERVRLIGKGKALTDAMGGTGDLTRTHLVELIQEGGKWKISEFQNSTSSFEEARWLRE